jgi:hypothetical protein
MSARLVVSFVVAAAVASAQTDRSFVGRVVDARGAPVVGARVRLEPRPLRRDADYCAPALYPLRVAEAETPPGCFTTTDVEGVFRFAADGPEAPAACDFVVDGGPDYAPATYERARVGGPEAVVRLDAGGALTGVVRGDAGAPLAGAKVEIRLMAGGGMMDASATTGQDGAYRIERLPVGPFVPRAVVATFRVSADGYATTLRRPTGKPEWIAATGAYRTDFALERGAYVEGVVVDHATGAPRAGVRTIAWDTPDFLAQFGAFDPPRAAYTGAVRDSRIVAEAVSGKDGSFRLGPTALRVDAGRPKLFQGGLAAVGADESYAVAVIPRAVVDGKPSAAPSAVTLRLAGIVVANVLVRDWNGRPAVGVRVGQNPGDGLDWEYSDEFHAAGALEEAGRRRDFVTDVGGRGVLRFPTGTKGPIVKPVLFPWRSDARDFAYEVEVPVGSPANDLKLELHPRFDPADATVSGTVRDRRGAPIPGTCITAGSPERPVGDREPESFADAAYCDAAGNFAFHRKFADAAKHAELLASARGFAASRRTPGSSDPFEWTLEPGRRVSGVARWDDGAPAAGTRVFAEFAFAGYAAGAWHDVRSEPDRWIAAAVVGADGAFALDDLPSGDVAFFVAAPEPPGLFQPRPAGVVRRELGSVSAEPGPDGTVALRLHAVPEPAGPAKPAWDWRPSAMMLFVGLLISLAARRESARRRAEQRIA